MWCLLVITRVLRMPARIKAQQHRPAQSLHLHAILRHAEPFRLVTLRAWLAWRPRSTKPHRHTRARGERSIMLLSHQTRVTQAMPVVRPPRRIAGVDVPLTTPSHCDKDLRVFGRGGGGMFKAWGSVRLIPETRSCNSRTPGRGSMNCPKKSDSSCRLWILQDAV